MRDSNGEPIEYPICLKWSKETSEMSLLSILVQSTSFSVVLINFCLRNIFIWLISFAKLSRYSLLAVSTMYSVLIVSFFTYGILYIIAPWSFAELGVRDGDFFSGIYTDFSAQWFLDIGNLIVQTTIINIVGPLLEYLFFWLFRHLRRMLDQKSCCPFKKHNTYSKTIR